LNPNEHHDEKINVE
jgi:WD repeat-containing protein 19